MSIPDILLQCVLPLLLYSGAVVPLSVALLFRASSDERHRRHRRLLIILFWVQAASFLPVIVALLLRIPHAIHGLIWPALIGAVLFLWGLFHLVSECVQFLRPKDIAPFAEPNGPANGSQPIRSETNRTSSAAGSRR